MTASPRVTVVFLLYNARAMVPALVEAARRQVHPLFPVQSDWLECILMDDYSADSTAEEARRVLGDLPNTYAYRLETNAENLGLARTVNRAFDLARSAYVLTCHCDCLFADEHYVARMLALIEATPDAGAITGKPQLLPDRALPFAERVNAVANLMDILPAQSASELAPVGFAEGRCDIFRVTAMRAAGMYQQSYRTAGEDQALAARMREGGFNIYQAPRVTYFLSVSDEQNTLKKLLRHTWLFGKMHPLLLFADVGTRKGVLGGAAGENRKLRALLRLTQIAAVGSYLLAIAGLALGVWELALPVAATFGVKLWLFRRHLRRVRFDPTELLAFFAVQPCFDVAYLGGLCVGLGLLAGGWRQNRETV